MTNEIFCGCVDIGKMAIDAKTEELVPKWCVDNERYSRLIECFRDIDKLIAENDGTSADINVEDTTIDVIIQCPDMQIDKGCDAFIHLLNHSEGISFYSSVGGDLRVSFRFLGIWRLAE